MRPQPELPNQEVLAGLVERVTFHNSENGFCVLRAKVRGRMAIPLRARPHSFASARFAIPSTRAARTAWDRTCSAFSARRPARFRATFTTDAFKRQANWEWTAD